jgi:serine/threonine protein kinase
LKKQILTLMVSTWIVATHFAYAMHESSDDNAPTSNPVAKTGRSDEGSHLELQSILGDNYTVLRKLGAGGEGVVYLVKDKNGRRYAAKLWPKSDQPSHLLRTTPFQNAVDVHLFLNDRPYMAKLFKVIDGKVMILEYIEGVNLENYYKKNISKENIKEITYQILHALSDMRSKGVLPQDATAENILISKGRPLKVTFVDPAGYILVDCEKKAYEKNRKGQPFHLYMSGPFEKNGKIYESTVSLALVVIAANDVYLLNTLLTWLDPQVSSEEFNSKNFGLEENFYWDTFGVSQKHTVQLLDANLKEKLQSLLDARINTLEKFDLAVQESNDIFYALKAKAEAYLREVN